MARQIGRSVSVVSNGVAAGGAGAAAQIDAIAKQESISFLKKRNKKLFLSCLTWLLRPARTEASKSFLVLFFKKELLSCAVGAQTCFDGIRKATLHAGQNS
jgi:hypothetical protein